MHIPPYHKKLSWQRFLIGVCAGGVIAYIIFMYMHGIMYEKLLAENLQLRSEVHELQSKNESLLQDKKDMDEAVKKPLTIETIEISIYNHEQMDLDRLATHQLKELIKEEVNHIIGKEVETISESDQLLITTIENKPFTIDDFTYYFDIYTLTIAETVKINVKAKRSNT